MVPVSLAEIIISRDEKNLVKTQPHPKAPHFGGPHFGRLGKQTA